MTRPTPDWVKRVDQMLVGEVCMINIGKHTRGARSYHIRKMKPKAFRTDATELGFKIKRKE